ncbi:MAG: hypothetical protein WBA12_09825, partial [Catalinimonas sp.]
MLAAGARHRHSGVGGYFYAVLYRPAVTRSLLPLLCAALYACTSTPPPEKPTDELLTGEALAAAYCQSCHLLPDPTLLDKATWEEYMLPRMGYMMGIYPHDSVRLNLIEAGPGGERVEAANIFPKDPWITAEQWQRIRTYYLDAAPDSLRRDDRITYADTTPPTDPGATAGDFPFRVRRPGLRLSPPSTTLVQFAEGGGFYLGDAHTQSLYRFGPGGQLRRTARVREGAVALH